MYNPRTSERMNEYKSSIRSLKILIISIFKINNIIKFVNSIEINSYIFSCTKSSSKYSNAKLYCQETILNYFNLIVFIWVIVIALKLLKYKNKIGVLKLLSVINLSKSTTIWLLWLLILPFALINIYYDLSTIEDHYIFSFFSILFLAIAVCYWWYTKLSFLKSDVIQEMDPFNNLTYIILNLLSRIPLMMLFVFKSNMAMNVLLIIIIAQYWSILYVLVRHNIKLPFNQNFNRATDVFWSSVMLLVILVISLDKVIIEYF